MGCPEKLIRTFEAFFIPLGLKSISLPVKICVQEDSICALTGGVCHMECDVLDFAMG